MKETIESKDFTPKKNKESEMINITNNKISKKIKHKMSEITKFQKL